MSDAREPDTTNNMGNNHDPGSVSAAPEAPRSRDEERVLARVAELVPEMVELLCELVRIPTVNPPGEHYADFAEHISRVYRSMGYRAQVIEADDHPDHSERFPRVNVLARLEGRAAHAPHAGRPGAPCLHFNGHLDVVPAGEGWTVPPFGGLVRDGNIYGRGTCDMKAGIVASLFAVEAIRRAGVRLAGAVEQSATCDEESGGFAGVAYLCEKGYLAADKQDHVIITEPLDPDRVCLGHRGVYWAELTTFGRTAHGSMPFLGESAIANMGRFLEEIRLTLLPRLALLETALPVVPPGARRATINVNALAGGQALGSPQTPCVADRCTAVLDRRFLPEESIDEVRAELHALLAPLGFRYELRDRMIVYPTATPADAPVVKAVEAAIAQIYGRPAQLVASPGTYDQKHFSRLGGVRHAIAYGPGALALAHQPDEHVAIADLERAARVMALATLRLVG
jgi:succinyl-diaminopimelate desuccinylase